MPIHIHPGDGGTKPEQSGRQTPIYPDTDKTMLERVIAGEEVAWEDFYSVYAEVVRKICRCHSVPEAETDDIVQKSMMRFHARRGEFIYNPERAHFRTYFNTIVHSLIMDCFRKAAAAQRLAWQEQTAETAENPFAAGEEEETRIWRETALEQAMAELAKRVSARAYQAFTLYKIDNRPAAETAAFLKISVHDVYQAASRCIAILREIVQRCNEADPDLGLRPPEE